MKTLIVMAAGGAVLACAAASPCLDFAQAEFRKYLPSAKFALETRVDAALRPDAFRVCEDGGRLVVASGNERGCLYGLYSFLEREGGAGFYASWCERQPRADTSLRKGLDYSEAPAFPLREAHWKEAFDAVFAAKLRLNADAFGRAKGRLESVGGRDGRFDSRLGNCHTFFAICPPGKYFADHPEYFSMWKGRRVANRQLCLSNPEVRALTVAFLKERIAANPKCRLFGISQNDGREGACACPVCAAIDAEEGSPSGSVVRFANHVAGAIKTEHPDVIVETLAYTYSRHPPKKTKLAKNAMVCLCSIECDFSKPIPRSRYEENRRFCEDVRGWSSMTDKLYIWDYTNNFGDYLAPFPNANALQDNIRFFRDSGCVSLFEQGNTQGLHSDFGELKLWLLAKWMWNPELDRETLLGDFFAGFYGPAAADMRAYFDLLHAQARDEATDPLTIYLPPTERAFTDEFLARAEALVENARAKAEPGSVYAKNVSCARASVAYARMIRLLRRTAGRSFLVSRDPAVYAAADNLNRWAKIVDGAVRKDGVRLSEFHNESRLKELARALAAKSQDGPVDEARWVRREGEKTRFAFTAKNVCVPASEIACDRGVRYRMFVKARVKGAKHDVECLVFSLYDARIKRHVDCRVGVKGCDMPDGTREYLGWAQPLEDGLVAGAFIPSARNAEDFELLEVGFRRDGGLGTK